MEKLFNKRNSKLADLNLLADSLGHSLREGVSLFSINDNESKATFVTKSGFIVEGSYYISNDSIILDNIEVYNGDVFSDSERFDSGIKNQISQFIESVYSDRLGDAGRSFESIVESWGQRVSFNKTIQSLDEQQQKFNNTFNIVKTQEFERFLELSENISKFLSENKEKIESIPDIRNAVRLSNTISNAFNLPRVASPEQLSESGSYEVSKNGIKTIYDMVCSQELVKKEILESKKSFENVWATEPCISNLAVKMFDDEPEVANALAEAFVEIPYIALISKSQLSRTISNSLSIISEDINYSKNDLKNFVSTLFEMKKPLKSMVSNLLHEKYGVNINNLKEVPTFKTLLNTQSHIFESLAKVSPRGSVIKECLLALSEMLKSKNGVEAIDVNSGLSFLFNESGLSELYGDKGEVDFNLSETLCEDKKEGVSLVLQALGFGPLLEKKEMDKEEEEEEDKEEEGEEDKEEKKDKKKKKSKVEDDDSTIEEVKSLGTKELINVLSELEELISGPEDLGGDE